MQTRRCDTVYLAPFGQVNWKMETSLKHLDARYQCVSGARLAPTLWKFARWGSIGSIPFHLCRGGGPGGPLSNSFRGQQGVRLQSSDRTQRRTQSVVSQLVLPMALPCATEVQPSSLRGRVVTVVLKIGKLTVSP